MAPNAETLFLIPSLTEHPPMTNTDYEYSYAAPSRAKIQCNRNKYLNYVTVSFSCVECSEIKLNGRYI